MLEVSLLRSSADYFTSEQKSTLTVSSHFTCCSPLAPVLNGNSGEFDQSFLLKNAAPSGSEKRPIKWVNCFYSTAGSLEF